MEWISLVGIVAVLALFALLCFRGIPVAVSAPLLSILLWLTGLIAGHPATFDQSMDVFAAGVGLAMERYLLLFMLSALFGSLIGETGIAAGTGALCAKYIAKAPQRWQKLLTVAVVPLLNAVLTYSGVSLFVVVFAVVAIARDLFQRMDVPWHLYAMSMIGSATFTSGILPGSPSLSNLVPMEYLGTTPLAAPVLSLILSLASLGLGLGYMVLALRRTQRAGEGFFPTGAEIAQVEFGGVPAERGPNIPLAILPMLSPVIFINALGLSVELSMLLSNLLLLALYGRRLRWERMKKSLISGMTAGISPAVSLGMMMGFGNLLIAAPGFAPVLELTRLVPGPPYVQAVVLVALTSFLLGNANAGITAALESLGSDFISTCGVNTQVLHRLVSLSSLAGAAPHSSALCNSILVARLTHRETYRHYFVIGPLNTAILSVLAIALIQLGVTF